MCVYVQTSVLHSYFHLIICWNCRTTTTGVKVAVSLVTNNDGGGRGGGTDCPSDAVRVFDPLGAFDSSAGVSQPARSGEIGLWQHQCQVAAPVHKEVA